MTPVRPVRNKTVHLLWNRLDPQVGAEWEFISDVRFPFPELDGELCPDLALIPREEEAKNLAEYPPDLIEIAVEIVSPSSVRRDYEDKAGFCAVAGIPLYVLFDPYRAVCVQMWSPEAGAYLRREERPYEGEVVLPSPMGGLVVDTARLPVDPG
ncbi:Uma2 family endonuclease [Nocardiopsis potens]|uniref:Uma2 family endonuclease n=1 Tax=Nocardiopsis potens TaxID=1246458 RepID=UPI000347CD74|nr:Uma2 family endonuclease [Nocardiopsis potens]